MMKEAGRYHSSQQELLVPLHVLLVPKKVISHLGIFIILPAVDDGIEFVLYRTMIIMIFIVTTTTTDIMNPFIDP